MATSHSPVMQMSDIAESYFTRYIVNYFSVTCRITLFEVLLIAVVDHSAGLPIMAL
jgi:hypothetical protein